MAVIGAGLSGLAAGIRLALFGKRVCIFERHNAPGGLNSFYSIGGRKYDVGLHAVTNFTRRGGPVTPLSKALRQLRISLEELDLCAQKTSLIAFGPAGESALRFNNDLALLESEVSRAFPEQSAGFRALSETVRTTRLGVAGPPARSIVGRHLTDPLLRDMIMCPVLFYGSAQEHDMDFDQFAMLYQAIYLEGLGRPFEGIRALLRLLLDKYRQAGGERRMKCGVKRIVEKGGRAAALVLDSGEEISATYVLSSIGAPETEALMEGGPRPPGEGSSASPAEPPPPGGRRPPVGRISFVETVSVFDREPAELGWGEETIVFFNDSPRLDYARPADLVDARSGVLCLPNNFDYGAGRRLPEGVLRATCLANYEGWKALPEEAYRENKKVWFERIQSSARRFLPPVTDSALAGATVATDMFTPLTVERFTGRRQGAIYGSPTRQHSGRTGLSNLYLCGTDQGSLGIVGSMLSGILMANEHILLKPET